MSRNRLYFDSAATTPIDPKVLREYVWHLKNTTGNASSISKEGVAAKKVLETSRKEVAASLGARPLEVVFTSGGTESNNLAIMGTFESLGGSDFKTQNGKKFHAITTEIEHSSVLECFRQLEKKGLQVTYLPVSSGGVIDSNVLKKALRPETALVSIQYANGEIGVIQPIREISKVIRDFNSRFAIHASRLKTQFHTDVSQAASYLNLSVERLGVDLMTLDSHKIYGPKGVGALYLRSGVKISQITFGGGQEGGMRSGTENVPAIAAFAKALQICAVQREKESLRLATLRDQIYSGLLENIGMEILVNGEMKNRLPNNLNISIRDIDTEFLTLQLDAKGIAVSTKSACVDSDVGSYVVKALGGHPWRSKNTLRISLGRFTTIDQCRNFVRVLRGFLKK